MGAAFVLGSLMPAWTLLGYDTAAHISEETKDAQSASAKSIVNAVIVSGIFGLAQVLVLCFMTVNLDDVLTSPYPQAIGTLFYDAVGQDGAFVLMLLLNIRLVDPSGLKLHCCTDCG